MSTTVDILYFLLAPVGPITHDNQLLKVKYAFNLETLIDVVTKILKTT